MPQNMKTVSVPAMWIVKTFKSRVAAGKAIGGACTGSYSRSMLGRMLQLLALLAD